MSIKMLTSYELHGVKGSYDGSYSAQTTTPVKPVSNEILTGVGLIRNTSTGTC